MLNGAFGTHGLEGRVAPDKVHAWERASTYAVCKIHIACPLTLVAIHWHGWVIFSMDTVGPQFQMINGLALLGLSLHPRFSVHRFAGPAIAAGGILFSGIIWGLVLNTEYIDLSNNAHIFSLAHAA